LSRLLIVKAEEAPDVVIEPNVNSDFVSEKVPLKNK
jgi:hypothetical protein